MITRAAAAALRTGPRTPCLYPRSGGTRRRRLPGSLAEAADGLDRSDAAPRCNPVRIFPYGVAATA